MNMLVASGQTLGHFAKYLIAVLAEQTQQTKLMSLLLKEEFNTTDYFFLYFFIGKKKIY